MPYRIRLRAPVDGHYKFWGFAPRCPWQWVTGAHAHHYPDRGSARTAAAELVPKYGPIDVVTIDGKELDMWEDAAEFNRRVDVAVAKAKADLQAQRKKSTWVDGVTPDYYRIPIPALDIEIQPFDVIDALQLNFNLGCVVKYVLRAGRKGLALDDLRKARNCIDREVKRLEAQPVNTVGKVTPVTAAFLR